METKPKWQGKLPITYRIPEDCCQITVFSDESGKIKQVIISFEPIKPLVTAKPIVGNK